MRQGTMQDLANFYAANDGAYGTYAVMSPFLGNHDLGRVIHMAEYTPRFDEYSNGDKSLSWSETEPPAPASDAPYQRMGVEDTVLFTSPGAPLIYYGDEIGLEGAGDPGNRRFMRWSGASSRCRGLADDSEDTDGAACGPSGAASRSAHFARRAGQRLALSHANRGGRSVRVREPW